eukprot:CAMPEP_0204168814 /NCGR_PEP_ID=MMETSP0361-20130328/41042_1 /ASSEMBLY_ACC=CAM_ASM_000343 /TAXON_ID=268821 /ORGANISM="Scrippsiella Hangoei, Strain SHTV-5" /LENGTH=260 /DNA_ID=CAMNT_0051126313 /DNA_START=207 /DNA_END=989 /DNA_ORIENTATION=+
MAAALGKPLNDLQSAQEEAASRSASVIDSALIEALYRNPDYGGLVVLRGAVGTSTIAQLRQAASQWQEQGHLRSDGQESVGRFDLTCMLDAADARAASSPGMTYGTAFLAGVCAELNKHRSSSDPLLEPGPVQLACYAGDGAHYAVHRDHSDFGILPFIGDGLPADPVERLVARRRVSAILYLQDAWEAEWGGAFRAHSGTVFEVMEKQARGGARLDCVDVLPEAGTLVMFRSKDLAHEVLPTKHHRFAMTMWCLEAART